MAEILNEQCLADPYDFNSEEDVFTRKIKPSKTAKEASNTVHKVNKKMDTCDTAVNQQKKTTSSIAVETDPSFLGPCEPGTSVILDAVVWHESNSGILVLNVTWRGKKYIGTLLDSSRHEWAPPSFRPESPSKVQAVSSPIKLRGRRGRGGRRVPAKSPRKWASSTSQSENPPSDQSDESVSKKAVPVEDTKPEPTVVVCTEGKCNKKFRGANSADALEYHRIHAHASSVAVTKSDCSSVDANQNEDISVVKGGKNNKGDLPKGNNKNDKVSTKEGQQKPSQKGSNVDLKKGQTTHVIGKTNISTSGLAQKDAKKIAVLKPLVPTVMPQQSSNSHKDTSTRTYANLVTVPSNHSQDLANLKSGTVSSTGMLGGDNMVAQQVNSRLYPSMYVKPNGQHTNAQSQNHALSGGNFPPMLNQQPPSATQSSGVKLHKRNSSNYSDISDASDQELEEPTDKKLKSQSCESALEERLYCNEELSAPSPTLPTEDQQNKKRPQQKPVSAATIYMPPKSNSVTGQSVKPTGMSGSGNKPIQASEPMHLVQGSINQPGIPTSVSNAGSNQMGIPQPQMLPHHAGQPMMYPYFPFMPTSQVPGNSFPSSAAPVYAAPYLMTYAGIPQFMPTAAAAQVNAMQGGNQPPDRKSNPDMNRQTPKSN